MELIQRQKRLQKIKLRFLKCAETTFETICKERTSILNSLLNSEIKVVFCLNEDRKLYVRRLFAKSNNTTGLKIPSPIGVNTEGNIILICS